MNNFKNDKEKIIISFTSYPKRINTVYKVLDSIVRQTILPDKIILYLSSTEFENFGNLPDFTKYEQYGFEIHWNEENLKSHKKWFYAFQEYQNDIVITIDDDILYEDTMLETLLKVHKQFPECVIARNAHLITCKEDGSVASYNDWQGCGLRDDYIGVPRMDLSAVGNGGVLYPTSLFNNNELFSREIFMEICQHADDLWLKIMEVYYGIPVVLTGKFWNDVVLKEHQVNCLFSDYNKNGGNDNQFKALLKKYPYTIQKENLINKIFGEGHMLYKKAKEIKKKAMKQVLMELAEKIRDYGEILVYGAGDIGNRIYWLLRNSGIETIKAYIVNNTENNKNMIENIAVRNYREFINSNEKIIIALFDSEDSLKVASELVKQGVDADRIVMLKQFERLALTEIIWGSFNSGEYWQKRYAEGGNSGSGSYNRLAVFKAEIINEFVKKNNICNVIEWGCGDGNQLQLAEYPAYVGYDVAQETIKICKERFLNDKTKSFVWSGDDNFKSDYRGELAISLDVIYHLVEDDVYQQYMRQLFSSSTKYVCIYSSNFEKRTAPHVKNRKFTDWIDENVKDQWKLLKVIPNKYPYSENDLDNTSWSDFYFYIKK